MSTPDSSPEAAVGAGSSLESQSVLISDKPKPTNGECLSSTKIFLRPSALSVQTEKLKLMKPEEKCPKLQCLDNSHQSSSEASASSNKPPPATSPQSSEPPKAIQTTQLFPRDKPTVFSEIFAASSAAVAPKVIGSGTFKGLAADSSDGSSQETGDGFVFGRNLHDRALNYDSPRDEQPTSTNEQSNQNLTFENAADLKDEKNCNKLPEKTLSDFAKEYEMKRPRVKFEEVDVITGEEGESNVLQMNCKLFAFDNTKMNWQEKGRGFLRLNDKEDSGNLHSRLIMRVQGSLKVVLNTKVWSAMKLERPSLKTLQFCAVDSDEGVKVYLIVANSNDAEQLFNALDCRIVNLKHREAVSSKTVVPSDNKTESVSVPVLDTSSNDSFESSPRKRFKAINPEDGSADSSTENITTEGTYDASSENSTDSTYSVKPYEASTAQEDA